jgi:hypothetical protein
MFASRRGFVGVAVSFVVGGVLGAAGGYSIARAVARDALSPAASTTGDELPSSGDTDLDELRWLAVKAPIETLTEESAVLIVNLYRYYPSDPYLWQGIGRLCRTVVAGEQPAFRLLIAKQLVPLIENHLPPADLGLEKYLPALRGIK